METTVGVLASITSQAAKTAHRARWFEYTAGCGAPDRQLIPLAASRRGVNRFGYDVKCSCGWESKTGGAIQSSVRDALEEHRFYSPENAS